MASTEVRQRASRDIWSHGSGRQLRDLLTSALSTLLMVTNTTRPVYFSSPWISDFVLFENYYREFAALFPQLADHREIRFSEYLLRLACTLPIRVITARTATSETFLSNPELHAAANIEYRYASNDYHEKGILAPSFYIEGSMNITYSGVYIRGEKLTYYTGHDAQGAEKIARAYLEFDRRWTVLG